MTSSRSIARRVLSGALISFLTIASLAVAAPASADVASLTINGVVTTPAGDPVAGETVDVFTGVNMYQTQTDEAGAFSIDVEYNTTDWTIDYSVYGAYGMIDIASLGGASETFLSITTPLLVTFTIQGLLTDAYGATLPGVEVIAYSTLGMVSTVSDDTGHYSLTVTQDAAGAAALCVGDSWQCLDVIGQDGEVIIRDITVGTGNVFSILIEGQYLDASGFPIVDAMITVGTDVSYYSAWTDAAGAFSVEVEYGEFGSVGIWGESAQLILDPASLLGMDSISVVIQQAAPVTVTFTGLVTDVDGNPVPHHVVLAYGQASAYAFTDAEGRYEVSVIADQYAAVSISTDGNFEPYFFETPLGGGLIVADLVTYFDGSENSVIGVTISCDVNGDGIEDNATDYRTIASGRNDWWIDLGTWEWLPATFGQGEITEAHCADLNGDGASEIIARSETATVDPLSGATILTNMWSVYEYVTGNVTDSTFGDGTLAVYFEDLDDAPGVELIVTRTNAGRSGKWWILDDPASTVEDFKLGFGSAGTLAFEDVDGAPGVEIVTSILQPNGNIKVEYYTRATGVGTIVKYTVK